MGATSANHAMWTLTRALLVATAVASGASALAREPLPLAGQYRVERYEFASTAAATEAQAKAVVGAIAVFGRKSARFNGQSCRLTSVEQREVSTSDYLLEGHRTSPRQLGIMEKKVRVTTTNCEGALREIIQLDPRNLVLEQDGVFYFLVKESAPSSGPPRRVSGA